MAESLRIAVVVGVTAKIGEMDFIKPEVTAELSFPDTPDEITLKEKWKWLWEVQVGPQVEDMMGLMQKKVVENHPSKGSYNQV